MLSRILFLLGQDDLQEAGHDGTVLADPVDVFDGVRWRAEVGIGTAHDQVVGQTTVGVVLVQRLDLCHASLDLDGPGIMGYTEFSQRFCNLTRTHLLARRTVYVRRLHLAKLLPARDLVRPDAMVWTLGMEHGRFNQDLARHIFNNCKLEQLLGREREFVIQDDEVRTRSYSLLYLDCSFDHSIKTSEHSTLVVCPLEACGIKVRNGVVRTVFRDKAVPHVDGDPCTYSRCCLGRLPLCRSCFGRLSG